MKKIKIRPGIKDQNNKVFLKAFKRAEQEKLARTWQITNK